MSIFHVCHVLDGFSLMMARCQKFTHKWTLIHEKRYSFIHDSDMWSVISDWQSFVHTSDSWSFIIIYDSINDKWSFSLKRCLLILLSGGYLFKMDGLQGK